MRIREIPLPAGRHRAYAGMAILTLALTLAACTQSSVSKLQTSEDLRASIIAQCNTPEKQQSEDCMSKCSTFGDLEWCVKEKYSCPTDGSYKGVNPYTGEDVALPETPAVVEDPSLSESASATTIDDGTIHSQIITNGEAIMFGAGTTASLTLGSPIISTATYKDTTGAYYLIAGTAKDLVIVPFSYDAASGAINAIKDGMKSFTKLGGIEQVIMAASIDMSKKLLSNSLPIDVMMSSSAPKATTSKAVDYVYMLTASGDVWRTKFVQLMSGGCLERIYAATDTERAERIGVAGQYVAAVGAGKVSAVNLMTSTTGAFTEVAKNKNVTDVLLWGGTVFAAESDPAQVKLLTSNLTGENKTAVDYSVVPTKDISDLKMTDDGTSIYVRGSNKYLSIVSVADPNNVTEVAKEKIQNNGTPKDIIYDKKTNELITTFTDGTIEKLSVTSLQ